MRSLQGMAGDQGGGGKVGGGVWGCGGGPASP